MCVWMLCLVVLFKQKTAYELRIRDWSSDVCSSDRCWMKYRMKKKARAGPCSSTISSILATRGTTQSTTPTTTTLAGMVWLLSVTGWLTANRDLMSVVSGKGMTVRECPGGVRVVKNKIKHYTTCHITKVSTTH